MLLQEKKVIIKTRSYKKEICRLEKIVNRWEEELRLKDLEKLSRLCYEEFNELLMDLAHKVKTPALKEKCQIDVLESQRIL